MPYTLRVQMAWHLPLSSVDTSDSCFLYLRPPPISPLFPYTTLFRSREPSGLKEDRDHDGEPRAVDAERGEAGGRPLAQDRKSTRLNSSHLVISYAVFCLKKKKKQLYKFTKQEHINYIRSHT